MSDKINLLIIGGGAREDALGWNISQDPRIFKSIYAPGNANTEFRPNSRNAEFDGSCEENFSRLESLVEQEEINLVVVGPEIPLTWGIVDRLNCKVPVFGPTEIASNLESDKFFSYRLMEKIGIPQAESELCQGFLAARYAIDRMASERGIVVKARGLAEGKGVSVCSNLQEAYQELSRIVTNYGPDVLIAERLSGPDVSVFGISDGESVLTLDIVTQDFKRLLDGDYGPNTGSMGSYCPVNLPSGFISDVRENIMVPLVQEMKDRGIEYRGILYAGLMITEEGAKVIEFNVRFGDTECQTLMRKIKPSGLVDAIQSVANKEKLSSTDFEYNGGSVCCVTMASNGYPGEYVGEFPIEGIREAEEIPGIKVFHAGTALDESQRLISAGGRVLSVTSLDDNLRIAGYNANEAVSRIDIATIRKNSRKVFIYRTDIPQIT